MDIPKYEKTLWQPHIVDPLTGDVISEGTRFTSTRANNFEEGIYVNRELHKDVLYKIKRLEVQLELVSRVPGGTGAFFDTFTGEEGSINKMTEITGEYVLVGNVEEGMNILNLHTVEGLRPNMKILLVSKDKIQDVTVKSVDEKENQITIKEKSDHLFKEGDRVILGNGVLEDGKLAYGKVVYIDITNDMSTPLGEI